MERIGLLDQPVSWAGSPPHFQEQVFFFICPAGGLWKLTSDQAGPPTGRKTRGFF